MEASVESDDELSTTPSFGPFADLPSVERAEHTNETALDSLREQLSKQVALLAAEKRRRHWIEEERDGLERRLQRCEQLVVQLRSEINCMREGQNISDPLVASAFVSELNATVETILSQRPSLASIHSAQDKENEDPELQDFLSAIAQQLQTFKKQATRRFEEKIAELEQVRKQLSEQLRSCNETEHSTRRGFALSRSASHSDSESSRTNKNRVTFSDSVNHREEIRERATRTDSQEDEPAPEIPADGISNAADSEDELWQDPSASSIVSAEALAAEQELQDQTPLLWECKPLAKNVRLSGDRRIATFIGNKNPDAPDLFGYIATSKAACRQGGYFFEIIIRKVTENHDDGLAIGFTATPPSTWPAILPETVDTIEKSWLVGYDGEMIEGIEGVWMKCTWNPKSLKENDCVGAEVSSAGRFAVYVNGKRVFKSYIPLRKNMPDLYGVVDLLGNTDEVELVEGTMFGIVRDSVCLQESEVLFKC